MLAEAFANERGGSIAEGGHEDGRDRDVCVKDGDAENAADEKENFTAKPVMFFFSPEILNEWYFLFEFNAYEFDF